MTDGFHLDPSIANYAVMGNPIAHSKSPEIHHAFAGQYGFQLCYQAILVDIEGFGAAVKEFQKQGGKGLNITVPFKQDAYGFVRNRTHRADIAAAVNTIWFGDDGEVQGDTTDGVGLLRDLQRHQIVVKNRNVLVLGAGGAVRSVLGDLLDAGPTRLTIANRTLSRAEALAESLADTSVLSVSGYYDLKPKTYDVVINGTSAGLQGELPALPDGILSGNSSCYDMVYGNDKTPFVSWAKKQGAAIAVDGLGMLVEQAAESFYIWHGVRPETGPVIEMLRAS